ncbi:hypothetical protein GF319_07615 [Candidatus Bathyarchaeota archaeon]|nr:hypothetical protein [Candidatus Bathyarchaeota archaeon]
MTVKKDETHTEEEKQISSFLFVGERRALIGGAVGAFFVFLGQLLIGFVYNGYRGSHAA